LYINSSNQLLHFNANTLFGFGGASYSVRHQEYNEEDTKDNTQHPSKFIFVVEPGVAAELKDFYLNFQGYNANILSLHDAAEIQNIFQKQKK